MSKYTTELRFLLESGYDLGLTDYPIFDESYRALLNKKILDHYLFREIGLETPGRFKHYLKTRLNEVMPLYNQMYLSQALTFNPMYDHDVSETSKKTTAGSSTNNNKLNGTTKDDITVNGTSTNNTTLNGTASGKSQGANAGSVHSETTGEDTKTDTGLNVTSTTPQGLITRANLDGDIYASSAERSENDSAGANHSVSDSSSTGQDYMENSSIMENTTAATGSVENVTAATGTLENISTAAGTIKNTDDYLRHIAGNSGAKNFSQLLMDYRATFLNIDMLVIHDLGDLFMGVY